MEYIVRGNLELGRDSLLRIHDARELVVYVWRGGIWITQEGDTRDRFVPAGGWYRIVAPGVTLVSGVDGGTITLTSTFAEDCAERIDLVQAGRTRDLFVRSKKDSWTGWLAPQARPTAASL